VRTTVRLTPEDAELLAKVAWDQHRTQTDVVESLVRTLTLPPPPPLEHYEVMQALVSESNHLLARLAAAYERLAGEGTE
jgi:hypothetical protein